MATTPQTKHQRSLTMLKYSYIVAFSVVALILLSTLAMNQYALYRETVSRQTAALESRQSVRSQRVGRDAILLLVPGSHASVIAEMVRDVNGLEADRHLLLANYISYYPGFATIDKGQGTTIYMLIRRTALDLIRIEQEDSATRKLDHDAEIQDVSVMFYKEQEQLSNIQAAQGMIDADTDAYIASIRVIDLGSSVLGVLVLILEGVFVLLPATRYFSATRLVLPPEPPSTLA